MFFVVFIFPLCIKRFEKSREAVKDVVEEKV